MLDPKQLGIKDWILSNFKGALLVSDNKEARFPCPKCGHESFYFNLIKGLGFCHRCHYSPNTKTLSDLIGVSPAGDAPFFSPEIQKPPVNVQFPAHAVPVKYDSKAIEALASRGISLNLAETFQILVWRDFIMVPVYEGQKLVNIVSRRFNRTKKGKEIFTSIPHKERYLYQKGVRTTDYLFNFNPQFPHVTLVENTFNSIWLSTNKRGVSSFPSGFKSQQFVSNFGSYLSDKQIETIKNSGIETVFFLWDERAIATKYVSKLKQLGIKAGSFFLRQGQPDDYNKDMIDRISSDAHYYLSFGSFDSWVKQQKESFYYFT